MDHFTGDIAASTRLFSHRPTAARTNLSVSLLSVCIPVCLSVSLGSCRCGGSRLLTKMLRVSGIHLSPQWPCRWSAYLSVCYCACLIDCRCDCDLYQKCDAQCRSWRPTGAFTHSLESISDAGVWDLLMLDKWFSGDLKKSSWFHIAGQISVSITSITTVNVKPIFFKASVHVWLSKKS